MEEEKEEEDPEEEEEEEEGEARNRGLAASGLGSPGFSSGPRNSVSMLLSSEVSREYRALATLLTTHSNVAVNETLGDTPQREQSKKTHEASASLAARSPTRLL
jgi:hypothetical protein